MVLLMISTWFIFLGFGLLTARLSVLAFEFRLKDIGIALVLLTFWSLYWISQTLIIIIKIIQGEV